MNTLQPAPARLNCAYRDRDRAAARARLSALDGALRARGVPTHLGECDFGPKGHVIALGVGRGADAIVFVAVRADDGHYEGGARGNPPAWLAAHIESAWIEVS